MSVASGIGLALSPPLAASAGQPWYDKAAVFDADFESERFRWDGQSFTSKAAWLTAVGGVEAAPAFIFGPFVAPDAPNVAANGDFATGDLTGWTPALDGASSAAVVGGAGQMVSDGAAGTAGKAGGAGLTTILNTETSEGYLAEVTKVGTISNRIGSVLYGSQMGGIATASSQAGFSARSTSTHVYFFRGSAGTVSIDNFRVRKAAPFKGFAHGGQTVELHATTPSVASGEKMALAFYNSGTYDERTIFWDASGHLRVRVNSPASTLVDIDLGTIAPSTRFKLRVAFKENAFFGQLDDGPILRDTSGEVPGTIFMKIGDSPDASTSWGDGTIHRVMILNGGEAAQFFAPTSIIRTEGDSFMGGAGGVDLPSTLAALMSRGVYNTGAGGSEMSDIVSRVTDPANAFLLPKTSVFWDGDENGITTVSEYCDLLQQAIDALGHHRFIVIPCCVSNGQSDWSVQDAVRDEMLSRWPDNVLDWRNVLALAPGVTAGSMYADSVHLSQAAVDLMVEAIKDRIGARGW